MIRFLSLSLIAICLLTACGGSDTPGSGNEDPTTISVHNSLDSLVNQITYARGDQQFTGTFPTTPVYSAEPEENGIVFIDFFILQGLINKAEPAMSGPTTLDSYRNTFKNLIAADKYEELDNIRYVGITQQILYQTPMVGTDDNGTKVSRPGSMKIMVYFCDIQTSTIINRNVFQVWNTYDPEDESVVLADLKNELNAVMAGDILEYFQEVLGGIAK